MTVSLPVEAAASIHHPAFSQIDKFNHVPFGHVQFMGLTLCELGMQSPLIVFNIFKKESPYLQNVVFWC